MKSLLSLFLAISLAAAIWPIPKEYTHGDTVIWIKEDVAFYWVVGVAGNADVKSDVYNRSLLHPHSAVGGKDEDDQVPHNASPTGDHVIDYAIKQTYKTIFHRNFVPWKFHPRNWDEPQDGEATYISCINLSLLKNHPENVTKPLAGEVDESYTLELTKEGEATISANSSVGIVRGLTTFTQLFFAHSSIDSAYTSLAPVSISDAPTFQHRGLNLDVARNYFSVGDIKRMIDACAYNKMNRFHLHVTDGQSWPLEIPALPELSEKGAYRPDLVYTVDDFRELQWHAAVQGVQLITEIDMPGHTSSIAYSYPDLIAAFNIQPNWDTYAAEPPSGTLKLNSSAVSAFLDTLFADLLPRILPYTSYFHTGGDEVNKMAYTLDNTVNSSDPAVLQPLMQKFVDRNHDQVRSLGLTPIVWEEMLLDWNLTLGEDVVVQSWQSDEAVAKIVGAGHKALVGNYEYWYLDCGKGQWLDFDPSVAANYWPYNDYCAPFHNWRLIYSYDPLSGVPLESQHLVLGGEAHMWAEQTDPVNLDRMVWPRAAAAAEVLWSGAKDAEGRNRSQIDASPRLSEMRERLVAMGVGAEPIQMPYCLMEGERCQVGYTG
ncbi:glycoside hydrolase family 20 protein [Pleomassaria siparia CBS 279.74]|uniref:Beta-hexosaminidase n=1 Tax=Pleomassaria siparia CBS 279.74 TaxID=1314801 RepID=A0A6G1KET1_9PLEO|nr:glycoside hydrolase family 20 protein [Pleomassaria siparia CBS 279.74]